MNTGALLNMDEIISSESRCIFFLYLCPFATSEALHLDIAQISICANCRRVQREENCIHCKFAKIESMLIFVLSLLSL